ncbi:MAG: NAD(P)-dependent oxidoreductase, partial [Planctomycetota bacterium]
MTTSKNGLRVSVLGLGAMGSRMANRLLAAGHDVTVWNRTMDRAADLLDAGASLAATPRDAAEGADVVLSMVRDDEASRAVWLGPDGAVQSLGAGALAIEASTLTPEWIAELATTFESTGGTLLEAPVVGSRPQAEAGQLITLAAGSRDALERAQPVLDATSGQVVYMGEHGLGAVAKLAVNALFASQIAAAAEVIHLLRSGGVEDERWLDMLGNLPIVPPPLALAMKGIALGRFEPAFPVELVEKDLAYFLQTAARTGAMSPVTETVRGLFADAIAQGHGDSNIHGVAQVYRRASVGTEAGV